MHAGAGRDRSLRIRRRNRCAQAGPIPGPHPHARMRARVHTPTQRTNPSNNDARAHSLLHTHTHTRTHTHYAACIERAGCRRVYLWHPACRTPPAVCAELVCAGVPWSGRLRGAGDRAAGHGVSVARADGREDIRPVYGHAEALAPPLQQHADRQINVAYGKQHAAFFRARCTPTDRTGTAAP